jgi:predicted 2-oxoglutarate/Fe(II)-dependent dioxygenase YbiX
MSVQVINNYISESDAKTIIDVMKPYLVESHRPGMSDAHYENSTKLLYDIYDGKSVFEDEERHLAGLLYTETINRVAKEISKFYGVDVVPLSPIFAEVSEGGHNGLHCDSIQLDGTPWEDGNDGLDDLEFSALVYLNTSGEDYVGGEINFPKQKIAVTPEVGKLVFFRGDIDHPHEVFEVTEGKRYTLILFFGRSENTKQYLQYKSEREFGGI